MLVLTLDREVCAIVVSVCLFVAYLLQLFVPDQAYLGILTSVSHSHKLDADMENAEAALESIQYIVHLCAHLVHTLSIVVDFKVRLGPVFWNIIQSVNDGFCHCMKHC